MATTRKPTSKSTAKKPAAKTAAKKPAAKTTAKKPATKAPAKASAAKKPAAKTTAKKPAAKKPAATKPQAKKPAAKTATKKTATKAAVSKTTTKRAPSKTAPKPAAKARSKPKQVDRKAAKGFRVNEFIVYPSHGVGQISEITNQQFGDTELELFVINFDKEKMTLLLPLDKAVENGMRKLADKTMMTGAMKTLRGRARIKRTMWSRRAQELSLIHI